MLFSENKGFRMNLCRGVRISIIIALSIEMLMVVFKIALNDDYSQMISAFYLIISTTIMFVGLVYFYKTLHQTEHDDDDC